MPSAACPILPSADFDRTVAFMARLGFAEAGRWPDYLILSHPGGAALHYVRPDGSHDPARSDHGAWLDVAAPEAFAASAERAGPLPREGIPRLVPPEPKPWGLLEGHAVDPDGSLYRFGRRLTQETA